MKFISNARALPGIPSKIGSAPNANFSKNPAKPQRKPLLQRPNLIEPLAVCFTSSPSFL